MTTHISTERHLKGDRFLSHLKYSNVEDEPYRWQLLQDLIYESERLGDTIIVPTGFTCDLASIPRFLWSLYPPMGPWAPAAVVHDWLYHNRIGKRGTADRIFRDAMKVNGVGRFERNAFYYAVRLFGRKAWND